MYWKAIWQICIGSIFNGTAIASTTAPRPWGKVDTVDFRAWDLKTLFKEISTRFEASLQKPKTLQHLEVDKFKAIIDERPGSKTPPPHPVRPAGPQCPRLLPGPDENAITRPAHQFDIDDPEILGGAYDFAQYPILAEEGASDESSSLANPIRKEHFITVQGVGPLPIPY